MIQAGTTACRNHSFENAYVRSAKTALNVTASRSSWPPRLYPTSFARGAMHRATKRRSTTSSPTTSSPQGPNAPGATQLLRGSATRMPALVLLKEVHQLRRIELFVGTQICSIIPSDRIDCVVHCSFD